MSVLSMSQSSSNNILKLNLYSERSIDDIDLTDEDSEPVRFHDYTSVNTKIRQIRRKYKHRVEENRTCCDWWSWYWANPVDNLPFLHFFIMLLLSPTLAIFWFMDQDTAFITCGALGLFMTIYSINKFRTLIGLKMEVDKFKELNMQFRKKIDCHLRCISCPSSSGLHMASKHASTYLSYS